MVSCRCMENYNKERLEELLKKFSEGTCTPAEELLLNTWLNSLHEKPDEQVFKNYDHFQAVRRDIFNNVRQGTGTQRRYLSRNSMRWAAVAASITFIALAFTLYISQQQPLQYITQTAGQGQVIRIELPDSSFIYLSPNSTVKYPEQFQEVSRAVFLTGEAFFEVHKDAAYPFIVHTDQLQTKVLGTKFLVTAYSELKNTTVKVAEGKVQVSDSSAVLSTLIKNQVLVYAEGRAHPREELVFEVTPKNMNRIQFNNASFEELALRIYNLYGYRLSTVNKKLLDAEFTGDIQNNEPITAWLDKFTAIHSNTYTISGNSIIIK